MQDRSVFGVKKGLPPKNNVIPQPILELRGATFDPIIGDNATTLANLKKLQDQSKFQKARFSFKLYRRSETP